jgi:APA family basic amino acid/polyamine antiporter
MVIVCPKQARNPGRDMPLGIISATGVCTILYIIMCIVICMMVPYAEIDINAPFSSAFGYVGLTWAK